MMIKLSVPKPALFLLISGEFWSITHGISDEEGLIKNTHLGEVLVPQDGWMFYDHNYFKVNNFDDCITTSGPKTGLPCVFPFFWQKNYTMCAPFPRAGAPVSQ